MSMIGAGIAEGIGESMMMSNRNDNSMQLLRERLETQREIADAKLAQRIAEMDAKTAKGSGTGAGDPDILAPGERDRLAAMDLGVGGDRIAQMNEYASTGRTPMVQRESTTMDQPRPEDVDPSSVGADGTVYADAVTRRLQHEGSTLRTTTKDVPDQEFLDFYAKNSKEAAHSNRRSMQPKEYASIAKGDGDYQAQGLIGRVAAGGPDATRAGSALLLGNGKGVYDAAGVNTVDGSLDSLGKSTVNKNNSQAANFLAEADQIKTGAIKPKDMVSYIDTTRKGITAQLQDLRMRENEINKILADPLASKTQKEEAAATKATFANERTTISQAQRELDGMSTKVASSMNLGGDFPRVSPQEQRERDKGSLEIIQEELRKEQAKPKPDPQVVGALQREISRKITSIGGGQSTGLSKDELRAEADRQRKEIATNLAALDAKQGAKPAPMAAPKAGDVVGGYTFKGGATNDPANWVKAGQDTRPGPVTPRAQASPAPEQAKTVNKLVARQNGTWGAMDQIDDGHATELQQVIERLKAARSGMVSAARANDIGMMERRRQEALQLYQAVEAKTSQHFPNHAKAILDLANG